MDGGADNLRLSGLLSEWLFSSKFWSNFNAEHGTMFDQFEEDVADTSVIKAVIDTLEKRMRILQEMDGCDIEFTYRWTSEKTPIRKSVSRESLLSELVIFRDFLSSAITKNQGVVFSL
jgi:hypothetical protein